MSLEKFPGRQHAAESVNAPLDNAPFEDARRPGCTGAERGGSRDSTRKLAAADAHASIVEWDTCRKSW